MKPTKSEYMRVWRAANKERVAQQKKNWRERNREKETERSKKWRLGNLELSKEIDRKKYQKNRLKKISQAKKWRENNRDKYNQFSRDAFYRNREKHYTYTRLYRARKNGAEGFHTKDEILSLLEKQKGCCAICHSPLLNKYHADHITPLSRGGSNDIYNIQILCPACNLRKNATDPIVFMQRLGRLL